MSRTTAGPPDTPGRAEPGPSDSPGATFYQHEETCDVLIVGGGPAGLFLANLLVQQGMDAVVLERRPEPSTHSRAIGLHPPALNALQALRLDETAVRQGAPIAGGVARSRGRRLGQLSFERAWPDRPYVLALPQSGTEALLEDRLAQQAPGGLRRGWDVIDMQEHDGGIDVIARPSAEPGTNPTRGLTRWCARVVVGADGARSRVRDRGGVGTRLAQYPDTYLMGDFADPDSDGSAAIYLEPGGVVESFPLPERRRRWVAHTGKRPSASTADPAVTPADPAVGPADLADIIRRRTGEQIDPASSTMISAFAVRRRTARRMVTGRCVLIGDAAHEVSPIGGQGITLGWLDALSLAPLLELVIDQDLRAPLPSIPQLHHFERTRLRSARAAGHLAHVNMALGRPLPVLLACARYAALQAVLSTPVRHQLARAYSMAWAS